MFPWEKPASLRQECERINSPRGSRFLGLSQTCRGCNPGLEILDFGRNPDRDPHSLYSELFKQSLSKSWEHFAALLSQDEFHREDLGSVCSAGSFLTKKSLSTGDVNEPRNVPSKE